MAKVENTCVDLCFYIASLSAPEKEYNSWVRQEALNGDTSLFTSDTLCGPCIQRKLTDADFAVQLKTPLPPKK